MNKKIKSKIKMACIAVVALACVMPVRVFAVDTNGFEVSISSVKLPFVIVIRLAYFFAIKNGVFIK